MEQLDFNTVEWITISATLAVLLACTYTDLRSGKIPNSITAPFVVLGLVLNTINEGWAGLGSSLLGVVIAVALWFIVNIIGRILGAGDSKLLAAIGALQGYKFLLYAAAATGLVGAVLAIILSLYRGYLRKRMMSLFGELYMRVFHRVPIDVDAADSKAQLPYAVAISAGTLVALYYVHFYLP